MTGADTDAGGTKNVTPIHKNPPKITKLDTMTPSAKVSLLMTGPNSSSVCTATNCVLAVAMKCTAQTAKAKHRVPSKMLRLVRLP